MRGPTVLRSKSSSKRREGGRGRGGNPEGFGDNPAGIRSSPEDLGGPVDADIHVKSVSSNCHYLTLMVDGKAVSWAGVWDYRENFGPAVLRVGAVGGVNTASEHRRKGYASRVMENSLRWMRGEGFDTALLFGIPGFYPKFGYAPVIPDVSFSMERSHLRGVGSPRRRFVTFAPEHLRAVLRMHHANNAARTGPLRRDPKTWKPFRKGLKWRTKVTCRVAMDGKGSAVGYFVYERGKGEPVICEVGFATPNVFPDILAAVRELARRRGAEGMTFHMPEDDAFAAFCRPLGMVKRIRYRPNEKIMGRMINVPRAMRKLAPVLAGRMAGSGQVSIRTNLEGVCLSWSGGRMAVGPALRRGPQVRTPQWALCQMLYGYRPPSALATRGVLKASAEALDILARLFPLGPQFFYCADEF